MGTNPSPHCFKFKKQLLDNSEKGTAVISQLDQQQKKYRNIVNEDFSSIGN